MFSGGGARDLKAWLETEAEGARSNEDLARRLVEQCRTSHTILPGVTVIERLCADGDGCHTAQSAADEICILPTTARIGSRASRNRTG